MSNFRILIVDDSASFRAAVEDVLDIQDGIEVVGRAVTGRDALLQSALLHPDLILMDLSMPEMDGLEAARRLSRLPGAPPVVIMTGHVQPEYREAAERAGAAGFLIKGDLDRDLPSLIDRMRPDRPEGDGPSLGVANPPAPRKVGRAAPLPGLKGRSTP